MAKKKEEAERLRAAEKFMKIGTGEAFCRGCGYEYKPSKGDPEYPISAGTYFQVCQASACHLHQGPHVRTLGLLRTSTSLA